MTKDKEEFIGRLKDPDKYLIVDRMQEAFVSLSRVNLPTQLLRVKKSSSNGKEYGENCRYYFSVVTVSNKVPQPSSYKNTLTKQGDGDAVVGRIRKSVCRYDFAMFVKDRIWVRVDNTTDRFDLLLEVFRPQS